MSARSKTAATCAAASRYWWEKMLSLGLTKGYTMREFLAVTKERKRRWRAAVDDEVREKVIRNLRLTLFDRLLLARNTSHDT